MVPDAGPSKIAASDLEIHGPDCVRNCIGPPDVGPDHHTLSRLCCSTWVMRRRQAPELKGAYDSVLRAVNLNPVRGHVWRPDPTRSRPFKAPGTAVAHSRDDRFARFKDSVELGTILEYAVESRDRYSIRGRQEWEA